MYGKRRIIKGIPAILSLIFFGCIFIFILIYSYIYLDIITSVILTPFVLFTLMSFYNGIKEEITKLNNK